MRHCTCHALVIIRARRQNTTTTTSKPVSTQVSALDCCTETPASQVWPTTEEPIREWGPFVVELLSAEPQTLTAGWTVQHVALHLGGEAQRVMVAQMQWQDMTAQVRSALQCPMTLILTLPCSSLTQTLNLTHTPNPTPDP